MNRFIKYFSITAFCVALAFSGTLFPQSLCHADVTTARPVIKNGSGWIEAVIVDNYNLGGEAGTTKVFNEAEETGNNAGIISIQNTNDHITYHVDLKTLGSTTVTLTFEGKVDADFNATTGQWMLLYTKAFTAVNTQYSFPVQEGGLKWVRVGMESDDGGTDDLTIKVRAQGRIK